MKNFKYILLLVFTIVTATASAQPSTDEQLALQYYQNKEFDKALDYYEKLYNKKSPQLYYSKYVDCLIETKDYKKAEKIIRKHIKQTPEQLNFHIDLGSLYAKANESEKAKAEWEKAVKSIRYDEQVFTVANNFVSIRQYDLAIAAFQKGRKISQTNYPYNFELAEVYRIKGDKIAMINELLDALEANDSYIQSVQNSLQTSFGSDSDTQQNELVKNELLKRIAKSPDKTIFSELLIWMQIQQKDWDGAFVQGKALDKRKKEEGGRVMALAQIFSQNEAYDIAAKAYQYVISKGKDNYFYTNARMELVNVQYTKVTSKGNYTPADLTELDKNFSVAIEELGKYSSTVSLLKNYAHLKAFYLHKKDEAIKMLEEAIDLPQLSAQQQAECKLELADILLMSGEIWDASLLYSQVEKSFKYDIIGQEAKFRNARISYYTGDFGWAQSQLDVLKGSTSKLIANDAMELSLKISDALADDTITEPLKIFARAELLAFQNKDEDAIKTMDSINQLFPNHALTDDILFQKASIALKKANYSDAIKYYDEILNKFPDDILADDALFKMADLYENSIKNLEKAKELYQQLIEKYPSSLYVIEARKRFRKLRGDIVN